jgi:hypothetical protein
VLLPLVDDGMKRFAGFETAALRAKLVKADLIAMVVI